MKKKDFSDQIVLWNTEFNHIKSSSSSFSSFSLTVEVLRIFAIFFKKFICLFVCLFKRGEGKEKEREQNTSVREKQQSAASHKLPARPSPQPRCAPWLGMEPATFHFAGRRSNRLSHRAGHRTSAIFTNIMDFQEGASICSTFKIYLVRKLIFYFCKVILDPWGPVRSYCRVFWSCTMHKDFIRLSVEWPYIFQPSATLRLTGAKCKGCQKTWWSR